MKAADRLSPMLHAARAGGSALRKLNWALWFAIPFNFKHRFRVQSVTEDSVTTFGPYRRSNFNHIRGIHACGIATLAEFATGLSLLQHLDPAKYRIIMSELRMTYHYQAKMGITAKAVTSSDEIQRSLLPLLEREGSVMTTVIAEVRDSAGNHVATGHITWQLKSWNQVKTKL